MPTTALIRAAGLAAVVASLAAAVPAQAATIVGNNLNATPSVGVCDRDANTSCTVVPATLPADRLAMPANRLVAVPGVVVRWEVRAAAAAPSTIALTVVRGNTAVARSGYRSLSEQAGPIFSFPTRVAVQDGDRLGVEVIVQGGAQNPRIAAPFTGTWHRWEPALEIGGSQAFAEERYELLLRAVIEADADADGFGDESQDSCVPGGRQDGCPAPPPPPPPPPAPAPPAATGGTASTPPPSRAPRPNTQNGTTRPSDSDLGDGVSPRITALQFNATRVRFRISEPAAVSLLVQRVLPGRRAGTRCVKPARRNRRARSCTRLVRAVSGQTNVEPGLNTARLRRLPPGRYRVRLASTDLSGRTATVIRYFRLRF